MPDLADNLKPVVQFVLRELLSEGTNDARLAARMLGEFELKIDRLVQHIVCMAADPELGGGAANKFAGMNMARGTEGFSQGVAWLKQRRTTLLDYAAQILDGVGHLES